MKTLLNLTIATLLLTGVSAPAFAAVIVHPAGVHADLIQDFNATGTTFDKRSKPRVPGGSGCDDRGDVIEHPECKP